MAFYILRKRMFLHGQTWNDKKDCRLLSAFAIIQNCAAWYTARPPLLSKNGSERKSSGRR